MKKLYRINYIIYHMYLLKQILPPKNFQDLLEDIIFLYKNSYLFDREEDILLDCLNDLNDEIILDDYYYEKPNFILSNIHDTKTFDGAYDSFKKINQLLNNHQTEETFKFFDRM